eukprot:TRINITY_DN2613_c0_g1_i1.p1 TRINITY_DN2613_c0_g1~~TRINITY_DN2613_c0_g1_i1.p1  ORF type:complete len:136 (+),score=27.50 TRINITY_DN2613_c0_g1_i1:98-505(+)
MIMLGSVKRIILEQLFNDAQIRWAQAWKKKQNEEENSESLNGETKISLDDDLDWREELWKNDERGSFLEKEIEVNLREIPTFDPCPFQVVLDTPLSKVHWLFAMLGLSHAFIVEGGTLVGVLTRKDIIKYCNQRE